jgi:ABC-type amino acid transport substrate-binding protein
VPETASAVDLEQRGIAFVGSTDVAAGLEALANGEIDAFVYDRPILTYLVGRNHAGTLKVLPPMFDRQDYAFAVASHSPLREPIHRAVLDFVAGEGTSEWRLLTRKYLD